MPAITMLTTIRTVISIAGLIMLSSCSLKVHDACEFRCADCKDVELKCENDKDARGENP